MAEFKLDPKITRAIGDFFSRTGKAVLATATDALIDEVRHQAKDLGAKVDEGLEKTQRKVRNARPSRSSSHGSGDVIDADFEENPRRRR